MAQRSMWVWRGTTFAVLAFLAGTAWAKLSLGVRFPDIVMENVQPGAIINLRQMKSVPYVVINQSDVTLDILVEPEIPRKGPSQAKEDYEPVPNPEWLKIVPNRFRLGPGDVASAEVILSVPDDAGLVGKHLQVNISAHSEGTGALGVGVNHFVRFSVGVPGPLALKKEKDRQALATLDLDMTPPTLRLDKVPLGQKIDVKAFKGVGLKVTNRGNDPVKLRLLSVKALANTREPGWEAPDPSWMNVAPSVLKIKPNQIKETKLTLEIPNASENKGKKFLFLVTAELEGLGIPLQVMTRIFVTTE